MALASVLSRQGVVLVCVAFATLAGCGGGGGGEVAAPPSGTGGTGIVPTPVPSPTPPAAATQITGVQWLQPSLERKRDVFATLGSPDATVSLAMTAPGVTYWYRYTYDRNLATVNHSFRTADDGMDFAVNFPLFPKRAAGVYATTLEVEVCYDQSCTRPAPGSPYRIPLRLDVGYHAQPEAGITPVALVQSTELAYEVVAAAYSAALDAVITVSGKPDLLMRIHDLSSGTVRSIPLPVAPTSLALRPDGLAAAVGHDAAVSLVDLQPAAIAPVRRIDVPVPVASVLMTDSRIVAVGQRLLPPNEIYWIEAGSGAVARAGADTLYGIGQGVLDAAGNRVYFASGEQGPDDVLRMDLDGDPAAARLYDSRYFVEYRFCGRIAISPDGRRLYTGCGVVLATATSLSDDMLYAGRMSLSPRNTENFGDYTATALSVAPGSAEIALFEQNQLACIPALDRLSDCHTRIARYDATSLQRRSLAVLAPWQRGTDRLQQWGRHLMHRSDGSLIVIAEVRTLDEPLPTWLMHRVAP